MNQFAEYNQYLKKMIQNVSNKQNIPNMPEAVDLDVIDAILRNYQSKEEIYTNGSFFTGQKLATLTVNSLKKPITFSSVVLDPTCGTGNLLIECSRKLEIEKSLYETLKKWGKVLWGFDNHKTFIESCKLRLIIEALMRGSQKDCSINEAFRLLKNIKFKDAMTIKYNEIKSVTHLVMNPPFNLWLSPKKGIWKKGKINAAALIFEYYVKLINFDCHITAILPDVLRSGTRYENFRTHIDEQISGICEIWGRFNKQTDVDVFVLSGFKVENKGTVVWHQDISAPTKLADKFDICIGPVVHYRDPEIGCEYPFLHAKNVKNWNEIINIEERRRFQGRVIEPPFVVIKRTSSPSDSFRASAAIINVNDKAVAVENHLIVLRPKSGELIDCRQLLTILASDFVNEYLNERIRLRHLTVNVIKSIPFL